MEQELLFVGQEAGKLLAVRDIVQKVSGFTVEALHIKISILQFVNCFLIVHLPYYVTCIFL